MRARDGVYLTNLTIKFSPNLVHPVDGTVFDLLELSPGGNKTLAIKSTEDVFCSLTDILTMDTEKEGG